MTQLSDQIKAQIHQESIKEKMKAVKDIRKSHQIQRGSLQTFWKGKVEQSQDNYLEKLHKERDRIDLTKQEISSLESIESKLLNRIKNT